MTQGRHRRTAPVQNGECRERWQARAAPAIWVGRASPESAIMAV
jgi:hypothetical protein